MKRDDKNYIEKTPFFFFTEKKMKFQGPSFHGLHLHPQNGGVLGVTVQFDTQKQVYYVYVLL